MVIIGGGSWWPRRRRYGRGPWGYPRRYGRGSSCGRDLCLVESGCCLAEAMGCGPQLGLMGPSLVKRSARAASNQPRTFDEGVGRWTQVFLLAAVHLHQNEISPRRRPCCQYTPTCSAYALTALETHGLGRGLRLTAARLLRCRPGVQGGADPVPPS